MKTHSIQNQLLTRFASASVAFVILALATPRTASAVPLGTAFTYQGRLTDGGNPANGNYDLQFSVFDSSAFGNRLGNILTRPSVALSNGLFTVNLDFGTNIFIGEARWLAIGVRTNGSPASFTPLSPLQPLTPAPYALYSSSAGLATIASAVSPGVVTRAGIQDGQVVKSLNGLSDSVTLSAGANVTLTTNGNTLQLSTSGGAASGWGLGGNGGTTSANFLGTINNQALELRVNNFRGLRLEPTGDSPHVIGGASINSVSAGMQGATIGGGGSISTYGAPYPNQVFAFHGTIGGGLGNTIRSNALESTIAGGNQNVIDAGANRSVIGGGFQNSCGSNAAFVGGGTINHANGSSSAIAGGYDNTVSANAGFIGGGARNRANSELGTIGGGENNTVGGTHGTIGGGYFNSGSGDFSVVGGGENNTADGTHGTIGGGYYNSASGASCVVGGGLFNGASAGNSTVAGGTWNFTSATEATIGGGQHNSVEAGSSTISGGQYNLISAGAVNAVVGGGYNNRIIASGIAATIPGGSGNTAPGYGSFAAGVDAHANHSGSFVWGDGTGPAMSAGPNRFEARATGGFNFYAGPRPVTIDPSGNMNVPVLTIYGGSDVAEPFQMSTSDIPKGSVVVIDDENAGRLRLSDHAYDHRVAGIVSGANGINPGLSLSQQGVLEGGQNVALSGRVYVLADASSSPIKPGDLLTTSSTPGHAMKVANHGKAQGAILGKAMSSLKEGKGMVLVLVTLQ